MAEEEEQVGGTSGALTEEEIAALEAEDAAYDLQVSLKAEEEAAAKAATAGGQVVAGLEETTDYLSGLADDYLSVDAAAAFTSAAETVVAKTEGLIETGSLNLFTEEPTAIEVRADDAAAILDGISQSMENNEAISDVGGMEAWEAIPVLIEELETGNLKDKEKEEIENALILLNDQLDSLDGSKPLTASEKNEILGADPVTATDQNKIDTIVSALDKKAKVIEAGGESRTILPSEVDVEATAQGAALVRTAYQCFLLYHLTTFADHYKQVLELDQPESTHIMRNGYYSKTKSHPRIFLVEPDEDSVLVPYNRTTQAGRLSGFEEIKPHEIAQLIPLLRIYKIYRKGGKETGKVEMTFERGMNLEGITSTISDGFASDFYTKGRGCGVKSFEWRNIGTDPFTATRDLEAKLTLYFQHFGDLVIPRKGKDLYDSKGGDIDYRYLDVVLQADCRDEASDEAGSPSSEQGGVIDNYNHYSPECYEVAIEVGYADPGTGANLSAAAKDLAKNQRQTLYLVTTDHTFNINQDGTFELVVDFKARLNSVFRDKGGGMNVLLPGGGYAREEAFGKKSFLYLLNEVEALIKAEGNLEESFRKPDLLKKLEADRDLLVFQNQQTIYNGIMTSLFEKKMIYHLDMSKDDFNRFAKYASTGIGIQDVTFTTASPTNLRRIFTMDSFDKAAGFVADANSRAKETVTSEIETTTGAEAQQEAIEKEETEQIELLTSNLNYEGHKLSFVYFGDIIGVVTDHVLGDTSFVGRLEAKTKEDKDEELKEGGVVGALSIGLEMAGEMFDVEYASIKQALGADVSDAEIQKEIDDVTAMLTKGVIKKRRVRTTDESSDRLRIILGCLEYTRPDSKVRSFINLAHIPISLEILKSFLIKNVLSTSRRNYPYLDFIQDLLRDVVLDLMHGTCFGGYVKDKNTIMISPLQAEGESDKEDPPSFSEPIEASGAERGLYKMTAFKYPTIRLGATNDANPFFKPVSSKNVYPYDYLFIHANTKLHSKLTGDLQKDKELGIPHLRFGKATGLLKSANFAKTNLEGLPESRMLKEGSTNMLNQVANVYTMDLSMVGNNLFRPGQYVYFDPVAMGIGKPWQESGEVTSFSRKMGLGGYHLVTEVGSSISPGKFETSIKSLWETGGATRSKTEESE